MPKPECQRVPCPHCTRGRNGEQSCASGFRTRSTSMGCFLGAYLPNKAPKRILVASKNGSWRRKAEPVVWVEAPSYIEAIRIAKAEGYPQWIWVRNGIPQESRDHEREECDEPAALTR